jgi:voltage-gated potassium channel
MIPKSPDAAPTHPIPSPAEEPRRAQMARLLDGLDTPASRWLNAMLVGAIGLWAALFVLETLPVGAEWQRELAWLDRLLGLVFVLEYGLRWWSAGDRRRYLISVYSLVDLGAIIPSLLGFWDVRFLRLLRSLRVLRLLRFVDRQHLSRQILAEDSLIFLRIILSILSVLFVYSGLIYQVESQLPESEIHNFLDAFYFAVVTITTVGYGDITPISQAGRWLTVMMILTGVVIVPWQIGDLVRHFIKVFGDRFGDEIGDRLGQAQPNSQQSSLQLPPPNPNLPASLPSDEVAYPSSQQPSLNPSDQPLDCSQLERGQLEREKSAIANFSASPQLSRLQAKIHHPCPQCDLTLHEQDAQYCRRCGQHLNRL